MMHRMICFVLNMFRKLYTTEHFYSDEKLTLSYERTDLSFFSPKSLTYKDLHLLLMSLFLLGSIKFVLVYFNGSRIRSVYSSSWLALLLPIC